MIHFWNRLLVMNKKFKVADFSATLINNKKRILFDKDMQRILLFILLVSMPQVQAKEFNNAQSDYPDKIRIKELIKSNSSINWIFTGNSITQGAKHTHGMRSYPEIFSERLRWELQRPYSFIINSAVSGHTSRNILNDFEQRIARFNPKVVVLMIGTNDAASANNISVDQYGANLEQLINKIRALEAVPVFMSPNLIIEAKSPERSRLREYTARMRKVARANDVILVDNWQIWSTELQTKYKGEALKKLLNDPLHPNGYGHQELAMALFKELDIFDPTAPTCGGIYYEGEH